MLRRVARLLRRVTAAPPPAAAPALPMRRWDEELAAAGMSAEEWIRRRQAAGRLYVDLPEARVASLTAREPVLTRATIDAATRLLRHEFDLLGSGPYVPRDPERSANVDGYLPIDWYLDPVSGQRFPRGVPLAEWNFETMRPRGSDIKLPWELARCQHWPVLGQAYRLTGQQSYASEIASQLRDFMEANPVGVGVNWTCTMDVALRAANWALGLELVRTCPELSLDFWTFAYAALFAHGAFIERHLENQYEVTSNHFLSNVVGLFYLAAVFRDLPRGAAWDGQCREWLEQEMTVQVLPDGADYESSIPYHRLVTELFLGAAHLAGQAGRPLPAATLGRLQMMVEFLGAVLRPDGLMPQVGDADDGRLHVLSGYGSRSPQDPRHLFAAAAGVLDRAEWMTLTDRWGSWEAAWWGCDEKPLQPAVDRDGVRQFPDAGLVVVRRGGAYLLVTNGIVGTGGFGNHKHNDLLGFEYHVDGVPLLVDPGSYVYTSDPDARNAFRSTASHNTVSVDGLEQNEFRSDWLFRMFEKAFPPPLDVVESGEAVSCHGRHVGFTRAENPATHARSLGLQPGTALSIVDRLGGRGTHRLRWHFHFAPGVHVSHTGADSFHMTAGSRRLTLKVPAGLRATLSSAWYSPSYGVRVACTALDLDCTASLDSDETYQFEIARTSSSDPS